MTELEIIAMKNVSKTGIKANYIRIGFMLVLILILSLGMLSGCGKKADKEETTKIETTTGVATTLAIEETDPAGNDGADSAENGSQGNGSPDQSTSELPKVKENGTYDSKEEVAAYIVAFGKLPSNYITKDEARSLGWSGGSVEKYAPGKCIGGDRFGNYEGKLPKGKYTECDIDSLGWKDRGSRRMVFSDKEIYYTHDHYKHFDKVCDR